MTEIEPMPKNIATAINNVMSILDKPLTKDAENKFQKYSYTSIDGFLKEVQPACTKAGLIIIPHEKSCEVSQSGKSLSVVYEYILIHKEGDTWSFPTTKHIIVPFGSGTAMGTAQSYALKQFMRSLFQLSTGEKDDLEKLDQDKIKKTNKSKEFSDD
jgi:hypothetical protein|tara:strand:+ start:676 stop:1146 length:471 start_codon:yes stop_codon:yes gene_type:complete